MAELAVLLLELLEPAVEQVVPEVGAMVDVT
jgi:hypothetical protein